MAEDADKTEAMAVAGEPSRLVRLRTDRLGPVEWLLGLLVLLNGLYFYNGANWNQVARYDQIFAFVEPGTVDTGSISITSFITNPGAGINTGDWAQNPDWDAKNYYSNKAPGPSLAGAPLYWLLYQLQVSRGQNPQDAELTQWNCYLLNVLLSVVPLALAAMVFRRLLRRLSAGWPLWSTVVTLGLFCGTLLLPYATSLWGHATAAACVVFALSAYQRGGARGALWSGFWGGAAVLCEYSCAIVVLVLGLGWLLRLARRNGPGAHPDGGDWRVLAGYALGGLPMLLVYAAYHQVAFGNWWQPANLHNNPVFHDTELAGGVFGLDQAALWGLTGGAQRGLFVVMPWLFLAFVTLWPGGRRTRGWVWLSWACVVGFLAFNFTFNGWHGGVCFGPRYQVPVLPLWAILVYRSGVQVLALARRHRRSGTGWMRYAFAVLAAGLILVSVAHNAVATIVTPFIPMDVEEPLKALYARAKAGAWYTGFYAIRADQPELPRQPYWAKHQSSANGGVSQLPQTFNMGELMVLRGGPAWLRGHGSLLPWAALATLLAALALALSRGRATVSATPPAGPDPADPPNVPAPEAP